MNNKKYDYLAKNTLLFTISSFGSKLLSFFLVPLYTSFLTTEDYGTADLISTLAQLLVFIFTANIAESVLRFAIDKKENPDEILRFGFRFAAVGSVILGVIITVLWLLKLKLWNDYCYLLLFLLFVSVAFYNILSNYLRAIDKVADTAIAGILLTAVLLACNIILIVVFKAGVIGYVASMIIGNLIASVFCIIRIGFKNLMGKSCIKATQKAMLRYSIPLIFNGIAWWMNSSIDKFFIASMCGVAVNGVFAVAQKIPTLLTTIHQVFAQAWNLSAIKEFDKDDKDGFFAKTYSLYNAMLVLMCSIVIFINVFLARVLFAKDFFVAWQSSSILVLSVLFTAMSSFVGSVFTAVKNSKVFTVSTISAAIVNISLNYLLIPRFGACGGATATAVSFFVVWLIRLLFSRKYIKWKLDLKIDFFAYVLLVLQVVFESMDGHMYIAQLCIMVVLFVIYRKQVAIFARKSLSIVKNIKNKI